MKTAPRVTAIIVSKDRLQRVRALVGDLRRQDYPAEQCDIIVVDDGSTPAYDLADVGEVRVIRHERSQGAQAARNEAVAAARGELILMLDDDIEIADAGYLAKAVAVLAARPEAALVCGGKLDVHHGPDGGVTHTVAFSQPRLTWYAGDFVPGPVRRGVTAWANQVYLVRRAALERVGGYDRIYGRGRGHSFREESDLHARLRQAGYRLWFEPALAVRHHVVAAGGHGADTGRRVYWIAHNHMVFVHRHLAMPWLRTVGFLFDVVRYSWVQGRFRHVGAMLRGYAAGAAAAWRDKGPNRNDWLDEA